MKKILFLLFFLVTFSSSVWSQWTIKLSHEPEFIYFTDWNVITGSDIGQVERVNNRFKMQDAINSASEGATFILPSDTLEIEITGSDSTDALLFNKSFRLLGYGRDRTYLRVFPRKPTFASYTIFIGNSANSEFKDFTLLGPDSVDINRIWTEPDSRGIWGWASGNMFIERVNLLGRYRVTLYNNANQYSQFRIRDSKFSAGEVAIDCFGRPEIVDIQDSEISDIVSFDSNQPRGVGVYFHNHVNVIIRNTLFKNISNLSAQWWEVGGVDSAKVNIFDSCRFIVDDSTLLANIWGNGTWSNERTLTQYLNCYFENVASPIKANFDVDVINSQFIKGHIPIESVKADEYTINVSGSYFKSTGQNPTIWIYQPDVRLNVSSSRFKSDGSDANFVKQSFIALENGSFGKIKDSEFWGYGTINQIFYLDSSSMELDGVLLDSPEQNYIYLQNLNSNIEARNLVIQ